MKLTFHLFSLSLLLVITGFANAQPNNGSEKGPLNPNDLKNQPWFYSLEKALETPDKVYKLSLADQELKNLSADIGKLTNLQMLSLSGNKLKTLPEELMECKNLQMISLHANKFKAFPKQLIEFKHLNTIYMGRNKISLLPSWVALLKVVKRLDFSSNPLTPLEISALKTMMRGRNVEMTF